ncbi:MAG: amino acid adenylation domain-containing protein, partial [Legionellales bacterium]
VIHNKEWLTYAALNKKANQLAHYLLAKGVMPDTPIALCMNRSLDLLVAILAILKAGGAYLPIDPAQPQQRLLHILKDSQAPIVITNSSIKNTFASYAGVLILIDHEAEFINKQEPSNLNLMIAEEQLAYIMYTSGSSGVPKGVLIEHKSVVNYCSWFGDYSGLKATERIDFSSNHIFDLAVTTSLASLVLGLSIVIADDDTKKNPRLYLEYLHDSKVNLIKITPSYFKVLAQEAKSNAIALPHLKVIILGGENLITADCALWLSLYPEQILFNEYGPTEATVGVSIYPVSSGNCAGLGTTVPIGREGPGIQCVILDENQNLVSDEKSGELYIGGICLARGYLNQKMLTEQQFILNPFSTETKERLYKTGDLCCKHADGIMEYLGRVDEQLKIRGYRIDPGEIESILATYSVIKVVVVVAQKDSFNENQLVAYFIPKDPDRIVTFHELRSFLLNHLPEYMIPSAFVPIKSIPLTANGKLNKSELLLPQFVGSRKYQKPSGAVETGLAEIWSKELGVPSIGVNDDFFELGGHSLTAARIISHINNELGNEISLSDFYRAATIAKLAVLIRHAKKVTRTNHLRLRQPLKQAEDIHLSDFQFMLWMSHVFAPNLKKLNLIIRKRLQGQLNRIAIEFALQAVLKKHEVLHYHLSKFCPRQKVVLKNHEVLSEIQLVTYSEQEATTALEISMNQLMDFHPWPIDSALLQVRLFHLKNDVSELQLCMPHCVTDNVSPEILLADLSNFYLLYTEKLKIETIEEDGLFKDYIFSEQAHFKKNLARDHRFWQCYLKDSTFFTFPSEHVVQNMRLQNLNYSTYTSISELTLDTLKQFCASHHLSVNDGLCAGLALALMNCDALNQVNSHSMVINRVKSKRDNLLYDNTIGCFIGIQPVKVIVSKGDTLATLAAQIHQTTIDAEPHQNCPSLIKLTAIGSSQQKRSMIFPVVFQFFLSLYLRIFKFPALYRKIIQLCGLGLLALKQKNKFLINVNVHENFIWDTVKQADRLFNMNLMNIKTGHYDILDVDSVFDVCFLRDDNQSTAYIVISANLHPKFRTLIANEFIRIMRSATT